MKTLCWSWLCQHRTSGRQCWGGDWSWRRSNDQARSWCKSNFPLPRRKFLFHTTCTARCDLCRSLRIPERTLRISRRLRRTTLPCHNCGIPRSWWHRAYQRLCRRGISNTQTCPADLGIHQRRTGWGYRNLLEPCNLAEQLRRPWLTHRLRTLVYHRQTSCRGCPRGTCGTFQQGMSRTRCSLFVTTSRMCSAGSLTQTRGQCLA